MTVRHADDVLQVLKLRLAMNAEHQAQHTDDVLQKVRVALARSHKDAYERWLMGLVTYWHTQTVVAAAVGRVRTLLQAEILDSKLGSLKKKISQRLAYQSKSQSAHAMKAWHDNVLDYRGELMHKQMLSNGLSSLRARIAIRAEAAARGELGNAVHIWREGYDDHMSQLLKSQMEAKGMDNRIKRLGERIARRVKGQAGALVFVWHQNLLDDNNSQMLSKLKLSQELASQLNGTRMLQKYSQKGDGLQTLRKLWQWKLNVQYEAQLLCIEVYCTHVYPHLPTPCAPQLSSADCVS